MAAGLGIGILVLFSLGLNWFMRGQRLPQLQVPEDVGRWLRCTEDPAAPGTYWERRVLVNAATLTSGAHLVEQRRLRREADGEILEVRPERRLAR